MPMIPQIEAGLSTEPRTWLPVASGNMRAATAAAEPEEEPPGVCSRLQGFKVGAGNAIVSSVVVVLPSTRAPRLSAHRRVRHRSRRRGP